MTDDLAALARNDQYAAEMSERINRATMDAAAIAGFYRSLKADDMPPAVVNTLTYKFADWYLSTGYEMEADEE